MSIPDTNAGLSPDATPTWRIESRGGDITRITRKDGIAEWYLSASKDKVYIGQRIGTMSKSHSIAMKPDHAEVTHHTIGAFGGGDTSVEEIEYDRPIDAKAWLPFGLTVASRISGIPVQVLQNAFAPF